MLLHGVWTTQGVTKLVKAVYVHLSDISIYHSQSLLDSTLFFLPISNIEFISLQVQKGFTIHLVARGHHGVVLRLCATLQNLQRNQNCVPRGNNFNDEMLLTELMRIINVSHIMQALHSIAECCLVMEPSAIGTT